jgi:hypothetical protein
MPRVSGGFSEAIKGLKTLTSIDDAISVAMANAKVEANAVADLIERNHKSVEDWTLVPDFGQVCTKQPDDFAAMYSMRKQKRDEAAAEKIEAERAKIRAEEQAKAEREAQAEVERIRAEERGKAMAEQAARNAEIRQQQAIEQQKQAEERAQLQAANQKTLADAMAAQNTEIRKQLDLASMNKLAADVTSIPTSHNQPPLKLGEISSRLGFSVTADFLAQLGIHPVATERAAKLYAAVEFPRICHALIAHIQGAMREQMEAA